MKRSIFAAVLLMSTAWAIVPAHAQGNGDRGSNVAVKDRPHPDYDAMPHSVGAFDVYPSVTIGVEHNDNVFAAAEGQPKDSDIIFSVRPYIGANSTWSRHALSAGIGATEVIHQDIDDLDHTDVYANVDGRIDVLRDLQVTGGASGGQYHEPRTAAEASGNAIEFVEYTDANIYAGVSATLNRIRLSARVASNSLDYDDVAIGGGGFADQDFRDHETRTGTLRAEYAISPDTAVVAQVGVNKREYDIPVGPDGISRNSEGREFLVGFNTDITDLIRGEIIVGQTEQDYDDASIGTIEGLAVRAKAEWFPSELTTVSFRAEREVVDTGVAGSAGTLATREGVRVDHELLRNVILTGGVSASQVDFESIDRKDNWLDADVGVTYYMNRRVGISAGYYHTDIDSTGANQGADIKVNRVMLSLTLKL